ncbi:MAG TPA: hypothetical protein VEA58_13090 [Anaerovoracaceae bacterium]|nr:hypothetical protein [Anaerovoracaceae bacterium]
MRTIRNFIGILLIIVIVTGLGYVGWYAVNNYEFTLPKTTIVNNAGTDEHAQHSTDTVDMNAMNLSMINTSPFAGANEILIGSTAKIQTLIDKWSDVSHLSSFQLDKPKYLMMNVEGVRALAEGMHEISKLEKQLAGHAQLKIEYPITYETYVNRYNLLLEDQKLLEAAYMKIDKARNLLMNSTKQIPAVESGFWVEVNQSIYQSSLALAELQDLSVWMNEQLQLTSAEANYYYQASTKISNNVATNEVKEVNQNILIVWVFAILFALAMIVGLIGAIIKGFKGNASSELVKQ